MIKHVDALESHKIKALREGKNDKIDNFKINILDEYAVDKPLEDPEAL